MKYIEGFDRNQSILFPQCIDEVIPEDSEVRIIDAFVDALPLKDLGFLQHQPCEEGRPMYHPGIYSNSTYMDISTGSAHPDYWKENANGISN